LNFSRRALLFLITGLVAAVAAIVVVFLLIQNVQQQAAQATPVPAGPIAKKQVVVASVDIAANSVITSSQVVTAAYPTDLVPADAITDPSQVAGSTAKTNIFSGQILLQRQFIAAGGRTGASVSIPPGKVLVAFPATDMLNSTGAVQAGDRVDIMLSIPISGTTRLDSGATTAESQVQTGSRALVSQATLQNIEVYSVGFWSPPGQEQQAQNNRDNTLKVITFIVDHQEALILKFVKDSGGTIDLAVRSAADSTNVSTDPVTLDYLVDLYGFIGLNQGQPKTP
jgi:pilus assembly protein CpaB